MYRVSIKKIAKKAGYTEKKDLFTYKMRLEGIRTEVAEMLWNIYELVYFTSFSSEKIKMALGGRYTYAKIAIHYGLDEGTIKKEVFDFNNMVEEYTCCNLTKLVKNKFEIPDEEREKINRITRELIEKHRGNIKDKFSVNIFEGADIHGDFSDISEEDFLNLRAKLVMISLEAQEFVINNIDKKIIDYGVYLLNTEDKYLNEIDLKRKEEILLFTKIKK